MPNPGLSVWLAQQALDTYEQTGNYTTAAKKVGIPTQTFIDRVRNARLRGLRPTTLKDAPRIYER